jgi:hypothetical protein
MTGSKLFCLAAILSAAIAALYWPPEKTATRP